ncbi:MAG: hypothetical protein KIT58_19695 [Planctomycetota bacterium]|nr:hypothetical protein [Planctomycetota bacterium]
MTKTLRLAAFLCFPLLAAGCRSAPPVVDLTPRFVAGQTRTESLVSYAKVKAPLVSASAHVGFSWKATVVGASDDGGATVDAVMSRVVARLPGGLVLDTDSVIPLGSLLPIGQLLGGLVGAKFQYVVSPTGEVKVTEWSKIVDVAARGAGLAVPRDGSVPTQDMIAQALTRVYRPLPRRPVKLKESWGLDQDYHFGDPESGPRVSSSDSYSYAGLGEVELPFGGDEVYVEGLGLPYKGSPQVSSKGELFLGVVDVQAAKQRRGLYIVSDDGAQVLGYQESHDGMKIAPAAGVLPVDVGLRLALLEIGWVFFSEKGWR